MFRGWYVWICLVQGMRNTFSGKPPLITRFLPYDLTRPGNVTSQQEFQLPCEASGTSPLQFRWQHNGKDIEYGDHYRLLPMGTLEGRSLDHNNDGKYQCFVKNDFGADFSRKLEIKVTVIGQFDYANDKFAPVTLGRPIEIPCPKHEPSYGVTYRWGAFSTADPIVFRPIPEDMRVAVTLDGTLVIMYVTSRDVQRVNSTKGIVCEMSTDENATYSHSVELQPHGIEFTGNKAPEIYLSPKLEEEAVEGAEKKLYCLAVAKPPPYITWRKDGEKIEDGENSFYLPAEQFNRLLIITKVSKEHEGAYTCTATSSAGSFVEESKASFLTVRASPTWKVALPSRTAAERSKTTLLTCVARADPNPRYRWFRNGKEINMSNSRIKVQENVLELTNVKSWHDAVYQCVAENDLGMNVTSTWLEVLVSPAGSSESESSGVSLWLIVSVVLGALLIVAIAVVLVVCYKRQKARNNEERSRDASRYNDIFEEHQSNQSPPRAQTAPTGVPTVNGAQRRPTLPPLPQYQSLDPSAMGAACYEPLDPQELDESGVYERLDFRTMDGVLNYDNPGKPIPEYLELVSDTNPSPGNTTTGGPGKEFYNNPGKPIPEYLELMSDTNVPPGHTAAGGPAKQYYEPMESGVSGGMVHTANKSIPNYEPVDMGASKTTVQPSASSPKYYEPMNTELTRADKSTPRYEPMDIGASNVKNTVQPIPSSPKYYEPMAANNLNDPPAPPAEYYQLIADNVSSGKLSSSPQEYYVPMEENNSLGNSEAQSSGRSPECFDEIAVDSRTSKL